ncbi:hypothetical protein GW17_00040156 [Ensete ventricosum]|uniref:Uncharacterized protein n=1 Tax=Ensete ventricosum TaxID=4639 RepID=A0A426Z250_ENSVE|nr:hypothetical protein B296_00024670 [Ensete ventricosum]RWV97080.1 hypothetical protein GW17_00040156 [Ensete ventricosum]RZS26324.1 hypothetical protein BHM03_00059648 [Ensete ventricosum]
MFSWIQMIMPCQLSLVCQRSLMKHWMELTLQDTGIWHLKLFPGKAMIKLLISGALEFCCLRC